MTSPAPLPEGTPVRFHSYLGIVSGVTTALTHRNPLTGEVDVLPLGNPMYQVAIDRTKRFERAARVRYCPNTSADVTDAQYTINLFADEMEVVTHAHLTDGMDADTRAFLKRHFRKIRKAQPRHEQN